MIMPTRPERIEVMHERMSEIQRAVALFREGLAQSNNIDHQAFFAPLLDRIAMIVKNERQGIMIAVADDLSIARNALRRLGMPDIDPDLGETTPSILRLRGERGNLLEALDNALDAAKGLNLEPRLADMDEILIQRRGIFNMLMRLDERLRAVQKAVKTLQEEADIADAEGVLGVSQRGLVDTHLQALKVEVRAARFETRVGGDVGTPSTTNLTALARAVEAMRDIADDLQETVRGLGQWVGTIVKDAGVAVATAATRSWRGMRALVWSARRMPTRDVKQAIGLSPTRPDFKMEQQQQSNWAWCAVAVSVAKYYDPTIALTQCELANLVLGRCDCCRSDVSIECDRPARLSDALQATGNLISSSIGIPSEDEIVSRISNGEVLPCLIQYTATGVAHAIVITGTFRSATNLFLEIADPSAISGGNFIMNYGGKTYHNVSVRWSRTYRVGGSTVSPHTNRASEDRPY
jgi:hypothetical protein